MRFFKIKNWIKRRAPKSENLLYSQNKLLRSVKRLIFCLWSASFFHSCFTAQYNSMNSHLERILYDFSFLSLNTFIKRLYPQLSKSLVAANISSGKFLLSCFRFQHRAKHPISSDSYLIIGTSSSRIASRQTIVSPNRSGSVPTFLSWRAAQCEAWRNTGWTSRKTAGHFRSIALNAQQKAAAF